MPNTRIVNYDLPLPNEEIVQKRYDLCVRALQGDCIIHSGGQDLESLKKCENEKYGAYDENQRG
jgi:hypothetical protein